MQHTCVTHAYACRIRVQGAPTTPNPPPLSVQAPPDRWVGCLKNKHHCEHDTTSLRAAHVDSVKPESALKSNVLYHLWTSSYFGVVYMYKFLLILTCKIQKNSMVGK